jgi:FKBP-type peptidyl-prolyl cis-trans isomerase FklB
MSTSFKLAVIGLASCVLLLGNLLAQQTPAPKTSTAAPTSPAAQTPAAKTAAKPHAPAAKAPTGLALKTQKEKLSYALGMNLGANLHRQSVQVDPNIVVRGLKDALAGVKPALSEEDARAAMMQLQSELRKKAEEKAQQAGAASRKDGDMFLAGNKVKEGVVTLPSGLQYKILTAGTGPTPTATDTVVCQYRGTLINGTEFDSSYKRAEPATFPVNGVIKGWIEALQLMPVGSKWELYVPSDLAYGDRGAGHDIGPGSTLIFEVELLSIQPKTEAPKADEKKPEEKQ